jgi:hypothetical protein
MAFPQNIRTVRFVADFSAGSGEIAVRVPTLRGTPLYRVITVRTYHVSGSTFSVPGSSWTLRTGPFTTVNTGVPIASGNLINGGMITTTVNQAQNISPVMASGWIQSSPILYFRLAAFVAFCTVVMNVEIDYVDIGQPTAPAVPDNTFAAINTTNTLNVQVLQADVSNGFLYILGAGWVTREGVTKNTMVVYDLATGLATSLNIIVSGGSVNCFALDPTNGDIYLGGTFTSVNSTSRNRLACVDSTGAVKSFNPNVTGTSVAGGGPAVQAMIFSAGTLYFSGQFSTVSGSARSGMASVDTTGALGPLTITYTVRINKGDGFPCLCLYNGNLIFGGNILTVNGISRVCIAMVSALTGALQSWAPNIGLNDTNNSNFPTKIVTDGTDIWVAGSLATTPARAIAKFDGAGILDPTFNPAAGTNDMYLEGQRLICPTQSSPSPVSRILLKTTGANTGAALFQPGLRSGGVCVDPTLGFLFMGNLATASQVTMIRYVP